MSRAGDITFKPPEGSVVETIYDTTNRAYMGQGTSGANLHAAFAASVDEEEFPGLKLHLVKLGNKYRFMLAWGTWTIVVVDRDGIPVMIDDELRESMYFLAQKREGVATAEEIQAFKDMFVLAHPPLPSKPRRPRFKDKILDFLADNDHWQQVV